MHETVYHLKLHFTRGYIADPYFPEREELINIHKRSGINQARSDDKREERLKEYLRRQGISAEDYLTLEALANRPWYRRNFDETDVIIVPSHQLYGCLIEGARRLAASQRPAEPDNIRHVLELSDFVTQRYKEDGLYKRLVMPKSGTGQPLSNQRALRANPYLEDFDAWGTMRFYPDDIRHAEDFLDYVRYCGHRVGVGASRKMGFGRFTVEVVEQAAGEHLQPAKSGRKVADKTG